MKIQDYDCYRKFLSDVFEKKKQRQEIFSYQYAASKIGVSKSYLKLVTQKKRHISVDKIHPICELFDLNEFENQYFLILFLHNTAKDHHIKDYFQGVLTRLCSRVKVLEHKDVDMAPVEGERLFQSWLPLVIHSLSKFDDFIDDPEWIQSKLRDKNISKVEIEKVLNNLIENKFIEKRNGSWIPGKFIFRSPDGFDRDQYKVYKIGHTKAASVTEHIDDYGPSQFHLLSICIDQEKEKEVFDMFLEFRNKLIDASKSCPKGEKVFLISNNIFTLADQEMNVDKI